MTIMGSVDQLGYVVKDVRAAAKHWTETFGVGPFFLFPEAGIREVSYKGTVSKARIAVAIAYNGDTQIELIQQLNPDEPGAESAYTQFLEEHGEGLHHLCHFTDDYEGYVKRFADRGFTPYYWGDSGPDARFAYFPTEAHPGTVIEVYETRLFAEFFAMMRDAARDWDGKTEPVRVLDGA
jgi:hypothetical protein